jgi:hypothetical protein
MGNAPAAALPKLKKKLTMEQSKEAGGGSREKEGTSRTTLM